MYQRLRKAGRFTCFGLMLAVAIATRANCAEGLNGFLTRIVDQIETGSTDRQIAKEIDHADLMNALSETDIDWLAAAGAGPGTLKALYKLKERTATLPAPEPPVIAGQPHPTDADVQQILGRTIAYVQRYTSTLIDFTCAAVTDTYSKETSGSRPFADTSIVVEREGEWKHGKTITHEVGYYNGREIYRDVPGRGKFAVGTSWSSGEFANLLRITFRAPERAHFAWSHWEHHGGKRLAVFSYSIDAGDSRLAIDTQVLRAGAWHNVQIYAAYHGFLFVDPDSGAVLSPDGKYGHDSARVRNIEGKHGPRVRSCEDCQRDLFASDELDQLHQHQRV